MTPVAHIAASVSGQNRRGRSSLYAWLWDHFDQLSQDRHGRADWIAATKQLAALGLTGKGGMPLKPDSVRKVWERVCAESPCHCHIDAVCHVDTAG